MADWHDPNAQGLTPELLQAIMAAQVQGDPSGNGLMRSYTDPSSGRSFLARAAFDQQGVGDAGGNAGTASNWGINEYLDGRNGQAFNADGAYAGHYRSQGPYQDFLTAMAMMAGGYYGGGMLGDMGASGAAGAAGTVGGSGGGGFLGGGGAAAGAGGSSITLPTLAEMGFTGATTQAAMPALSNTLAAGGVGAAAAGGTAGAAGAGGAGAAGTGASGAANALGGMKTIGGLLGGALGAYEASQDHEQATNRDPWGPAQPFLKSLLGQADTMQRQYAQQPFSPLQQQAYQNQFGLLNAANTGAMGLLQGMQQNASGANSYDRNNPQKKLTGSSPQFQWQPGLLNFGG